MQFFMKAGGPASKVYDSLTDLRYNRVKTRERVLKMRTKVFHPSLVIILEILSCDICGIRSSWPGHMPILHRVKIIWISFVI